MVDLPLQSDAAPEVRAPRPAATPGDIAQPYLELSAMLDKTAGHLMKDVAEPFAEQAGLQAVSRAPDGSLQMAHAPIFGDAADAYRRAVKFSALAQGEAEARRADLEISKKFPNDPNNYLQAAQGFRDAQVKQYTDKFGPEVGISIGRVIDNQTTWAYRLMLNKQQSEIRENFDRGTRAVIKSSAEDTFTLIESGALDTPQGREMVNNKVATVKHTIMQRVDNPVLGDSQEAAKVQLEEFDRQVGAAKFVAGLNKILKDPQGGSSAAMDALEAHRDDPKVPPIQRQIDYLFGQKAIAEYDQATTRAVNMARKAQQQKDQLFENAVIADSALPADQRKITETDIKTSPDTSPESKIKMLGYLKREGMPEALAATSHATTMQLLAQIRATDPSKLDDNKPIYDAYIGGKLNRTDFNFLMTEFSGLRSPEGDTIARDRSSFFTRFGSTIDPGRDPSTGLGASALGNQKLYEAEIEARRQEQQLRAAGKDPHSVYDPNSPNYFGRPENIGRFRPTLQEKQDFQRQLQRDQARTGAPPAAPAAPARPSGFPADAQWDAAKKSWFVIQNGQRFRVEAQ